MLHGFRRVFCIAALAAIATCPSHASFADSDLGEKPFSENLPVHPASSSFTLPDVAYNAYSSSPGEELEAGETAAAPGEEYEPEGGLVLTEEETSAQLKKRGRDRPSVSATALAKQILSPEEFEEAKREVMEELQILNRFNITTTTTKAPGFLKEVRPAPLCLP